jgi:hypothetical protein
MDNINLITEIKIMPTGKTKGPPAAVISLLCILFTSFVLILPSPANSADHQAITISPEMLDDLNLVVAKNSSLPVVIKKPRGITIPNNVSVEALGQLFGTLHLPENMFP